LSSSSPHRNGCAWESDHAPATVAWAIGAAHGQIVAEVQSPKTRSRRCCETMIFVLSSFIRLSEPISRGTVTEQRNSTTRLRVSCPTSRTSEHSSARGCDVRMFGCLPLDGLRHLPSARSIASGLDISHRGSRYSHVSRLKVTRSTHRLRLLLSPTMLVLITDFRFRFSGPPAISRVQFFEGWLVPCCRALEPLATNLAYLLAIRWSSEGFSFESLLCVEISFGIARIIPCSASRPNRSMDVCGNTA
jgi:hypothetical protein